MAPTLFLCTHTHFQLINNFSIWRLNVLSLIYRCVLSKAVTDNISLIHMTFSNASDTRNRICFKDADRHLNVKTKYHVYISDLKNSYQRQWYEMLNSTSYPKILKPILLCIEIIFWFVSFTNKGNTTILLIYQFNSNNHHIKFIWNRLELWSIK